MGRTGGSMGRTGCPGGGAAADVRGQADGLGAPGSSGRGVADQADGLAGAWAWSGDGAPPDSPAGGVTGHADGLGATGLAAGGTAWPELPAGGRRAGGTLAGGPPATGTPASGVSVTGGTGRPGITGTVRTRGPFCGARCAAACDPRLRMRAMIRHSATFAAARHDRYPWQRPALPGHGACHRSACRGPVPARPWPSRP
jgi:hypothetical protein